MSQESSPAADPGTDSGADSDTGSDTADGGRNGAPGARAWGGWVLVSAVVGVGLGLVWALTAPRVLFRVSGGEFLRVSAQPEEFFAADLLLGVLLAVAGLGLALGWALRVRRAPMASLIGLFTGGIVAAAFAVLVGQSLTESAPTAASLADGVVIEAGLRFRSWAMLAWWPTAVAVVFAVALAGAADARRSGAAAEARRSDATADRGGPGAGDLE